MSMKWDTHVCCLIVCVGHVCVCVCVLAHVCVGVCVCVCVCVFTAYQLTSSSYMPADFSYTVMYVCVCDIAHNTGSY